MLQEADNRIHSDTIQYYKRQTIEYTLTVYCILSECIQLSTSCNSVYCQSVFYCLPLVTLYTVRVYSIVCLLYQCILSECILLSTSCISLYCQSVFYCLSLKRQTIDYTLTVYNVTRGRQ
jgi:hypothetical protein